MTELTKDPAVNEQFKLTAIIVNDPKDKNLAKHIKSHFLDFAKLTGRHLLIITFVQPPVEHVNAIRYGEYEYAKLLVEDSNQLSNTDETINPFIRIHYRLPKDGSYLILAKKLSDNEVFKVRTTTGSLPYQLMDLTSYCYNPTNFDELMNQLEAESFNISEMLGNSLLKIFSLISPSSSYDNYGPQLSQQRHLARKTIEEEKQKLKDALRRSSDDEDLTGQVIYIYGLIEYAYRYVLNDRQYHTIRTYRFENYRLLDGKSKKFWRSYSRLLECLRGTPLDELDYSAFIIYLGKILETELNLSVCQMLRQTMGITMPDFYNKYCYGIGSVIIPPNRTNGVALNRYFLDRNKKRQFESVPLGKLLFAYRAAEETMNNPYSEWELYYPEKFEQMPFRFLLLWEDLAKLRNIAAHAQNVNNDSYRTTEELFYEFQKNYLSIICGIKERLKPKRITNNRQIRH